MISHHFIERTGTTLLESENFKSKIEECLIYGFLKNVLRFDDVRGSISACCVKTEKVENSKFGIFSWVYMY